MVDDSPGADKSKKKYLQTSCLVKTMKSVDLFFNGVPLASVLKSL